LNLLITNLFNLKLSLLANKQTLIQLIVFLFPIFVVTVQHGGSVLFALLLLAGLVSGWSMWRSLDVSEKKVLLGFVLFFVLVSLSLLNTQDFSSGIKREGRYILFPLLIPIYLLFKKYHLETGKVFFLGLVVASIALFSQAYYQINVLDLWRAKGAYNSLIFGDFSMFVVVLVIAFLLTVAHKWQHYLVGGGAIAMALSASVMSSSKGAWVLLPIALVWFVFITHKNVAKSISLVVIIGALLVVGAFNVDRVKSRADGAIVDYHTVLQNSVKNESARSVSVRLEMWRNSITIWKDHPLLGTGIGDFKYEILQAIEEGESQLAMSYGHAHNIYFDALATAGLVGLIGMLVFMQIIPFQFFYVSWVSGHEPWVKFYALSGMTTIIAFAVFGLSEGWLARKAFVYTYLISILVFMSSIAVVKEKQVISHKS